MRLNCIILIAILFTTGLAASELCDFEDGTLEVSPNGAFAAYNGGDYTPRVQTLSNDGTLGANGTSKCLKNYIEDGGCDIYYWPNYGYEEWIPQADGCDRLTFWIKLPSDFPAANDRNFNVGTYTDDPEYPPATKEGQQHYYHFLNLIGSEYWTKVKLNRHPQLKNVAPDDPVNNPTSIYGTTWDYWDGMCEFYVMTEGHDIYTPPWTLYLDEFSFSVEPEAENDDNINSISCVYLGSGQFRLGWYGNSRLSYNGDTYNVYYASVPLTNANYSSVGTLGASNVSKTAQAYGSLATTISTGITTGTVYFAIKDLDDDSTVVSKIDYPIDAGSSSPSTPSLRGVSLHGVDIH